MVTVYVCIIGDLFHSGHVTFLEEASKFGDKLIVGVLDDDDCVIINKEPCNKFDERIRVVESCKFVNKVVKAPFTIDANFMNKYNIDMVCVKDNLTTNFINDIYKIPLVMNKLYMVETKSKKYTTTDDIIRNIMLLYRY